MQVYARLNHLNMCLSYPATLWMLSEVAEFHKLPIEKWIAEDAVFKFIGDNVDKHVGVRDVRSGNQSQFVHMYSILAVRSRLPREDLSRVGTVGDLSKIKFRKFLPSCTELQNTRKNLVVLVGRVLTKYVESLKPLAQCVSSHIPHQYSKEMSEKSQIAVLDVLVKNEASGAEMIDIMKTMQGYLGNGYPAERRVASGGDQLTCKRQAASQRHLMDSNTPAE